MLSTNYEFLNGLILPRQANKSASCKKSFAQFLYHNRGRPADKTAPDDAEDRCALLREKTLYASASH
jgi:hypothetical protein